jgi:hypothetical protein
MQLSDDRNDDLFASPISGLESTARGRSSMSIHRRTFWLVLSALIISASEGCLPNTEPEHNILCLVNSADMPGWSVAGSTRRGYVEYPEHVETFGSTTIPYDLHVRQDPNADIFKKDTSPYWVGISVQRLTSDPDLGKSMLYQPEDAWVEINGKRTAASGIAKFSSQDDKPRNVIWPVNLLALDSDPSDDTLYVAFPVRWPYGPQDKWIVHLGTVKLGDKVLTIPDYKSRFTPAGTVWIPIFMGLAS